MKNQLKTNIIDTLSYFDVFSYPLTLEQVELFLHFQELDKKNLKSYLSKIPIIEKKYGYYFFSGREQVAVRRKMKETENERKLTIAKKYISLLSNVPGVKMIGITGSLSMGNASENDDIDLFIITRKNTLWITRFLVVCVTKCIGRRRSYGDKKVKDRLCLNMFLDERDLEFSEKSLYIAHEIVQMKVYYDEHRMFREFIEKNSWIQEFFPSIEVKRSNQKRKKRWFDFLFFSDRLVRFFNLFAFIFQYLYMSSKITREKVSLRKAFFHPNEYSGIILREYRKRSNDYQLMYENSNKLLHFEVKKGNVKPTKHYN